MNTERILGTWVAITAAALIACLPDAAKAQQFSGLLQAFKAPPAANAPPAGAAKDADHRPARPTKAATAVAEPQPVDEPQPADEPAAAPTEAHPYAANNMQGPGYDVYGKPIYSPQQARAMGILNAVQAMGSGNLQTWVGADSTASSPPVDNSGVAIDQMIGGAGLGGGPVFSGAAVAAGYPQASPYMIPQAAWGLGSGVYIGPDYPPMYQTDLARQRSRTIEYAMRVDAARSFFTARMLNRSFHEAERHYQLPTSAVSSPPPYQTLSESLLDPATGRIEWPAELLKANFEPPRHEIERLLRPSNAGRPVTSPSYTRVVAATRTMKDTLTKDLPNLAPEDYMASAKFLNNLVYTVKHWPGSADLTAGTESPNVQPVRLVHHKR